MRSRQNDEAMVELYRDDPAYAVDLLNSVLEDGDEAELLILLRQMNKAFGDVQSILETPDVKLTVLDRTPALQQGAANVKSLSSILKTMGLRLTVERAHTV